jgi:sec-independent protein translocase protein TatC
VHRQYNEDLFESTKMTFGEHLEELRRALLKAVLSLFIGFLIGMLLSKHLIRFVQTPLREALQNYYSSLEAEQQEQRLLSAGSPISTADQMEQAKEEFAKQGLTSQEWLVDWRQFAELLSKIAPGAVDLSALPQRKNPFVTSEDLVPLRLYRHVEDDPRVRVVGLRMEESFVVWMKAAFVLGAIISSPFVFYFIWQFVAAGLYPHEKRYVHIFLPFSIGLFLIGAALAFFVVFRFVLAFLLSFYDWLGVDPDARISDWLTFVLILPLGFGIAFQLPLVMLFLERIGIFSISTYLSSWRISVLVIAFLSMVLTPSDPYSMLLMGGPLIVLYFFGIALCRLMPRRTTPFGEPVE